METWIIVLCVLAILVILFFIVLSYRMINQNGEITCTTSTECPSTHICLDGVCVPGCRDDSGCPSGRICVEGMCLDGCVTKSDCLSGHLCIDGLCVPGCDTKSDCTFGNVCVNQTCVPGCETEFDCENNEQCLEGQCVTGNQCVTSSDCPAGLICTYGNCQTLFLNGQKITLTMGNGFFIFNYPKCYPGGINTIIVFNPVDDPKITARTIFTVNNVDGGIKLVPNQGNNEIFNNIFYTEVINMEIRHIRLYTLKNGVKNYLSYASTGTVGILPLCHKYKLALSTTPQNMTYTIV